MHTWTATCHCTIIIIIIIIIIIKIIKIMIIPRPQLTNSALCGSVINLLPSPVRPHATHCPTMLHINVSSFSWPTPPAKVWSAVPVDAICATWPITFGISKYGQILMEKLKTLHLLGWLYQRIVYQVWQ